MGKKRLIIDLSSPHNSKSHSSINNLIDKDQCTLSYARIDDAISKICEFGKGAVLCKFEIQDAFKHCPVTKDQWHLFLVRWNRMYYILTRLAFGCRSSPRIFDNLAGLPLPSAKCAKKIHLARLFFIWRKRLAHTFFADIFIFFFVISGMNCASG